MNVGMNFCLFPADVALGAKLFGYMEVDDSEMFLDTDALPHVHCHYALLIGYELLHTLPYAKHYS